MKINGIDTTKGGTINAFIEWLWYRGYDITKADAPNANFQCYNATITDKSGYNTITIFFGGETPKITARVDKVNGTHKWYYGKTLAQMMAIIRQCMEGYTFEEHTTEPAADADENKEENTMETIELKAPVTFERAGGRAPVTMIRAERMYPTDNWHFVDEDHATWYRKPEWDEDGKIAYYMPDSVKGQRILVTEQELNDMINNTKEDTTMKTTNTSNPVTIDLTEGVAKFELNGTTYKYNIESKRYAKTTDGKTTRIGKAEYEAAKATYDQQVLDDQPSHVEIENDLDKPAVLNENGLVDCSKCNCDKCVHRNCMRRNPRNVGGLGECPRLDNGIVSEAQKIAEETGMGLAEAELEANIRNEQKKARKARKSKDIAYEGNGVTLTAKQVDFLLDLKMTDQWDGFDTMLWTDVICDEIEGQFAGKPMTVGAMISTLCEKGLAERSKGEFTDPVTNRTRKSTYMAFTGPGQKIAEELGL